MFVLLNSNDLVFTVPSFIQSNLKGFPVTIHRPSRRYPLELAGRTQVHSLWKQEIKEQVIPLFAPQNQAGEISVEGGFNLLWYPEVPQENDHQREYAKLIEPAAVCRNITGFYLGSLEDPHICTFHTSQGNHEHLLLQVEEGSYLKVKPAKGLKLYVKTS